MAAIDDTCSTPPTRLDASLLRGGPDGNFGAGRPHGKTHQGIDVVANQTSMDKATYSVFSTGDEVVAYSRLNGSNANPGYGYTVVIDHQNGFYTLYAHLAVAASTGLTTVGQHVKAGEVIGYLADLTNGEKSSGNARAVAPYDRIQLHFECFEADAGRQSSGALAAIKGGRTIDDPTYFFTVKFGYQSF